MKISFENLIDSNKPFLLGCGAIAVITGWSTLLLCVMGAFINYSLLPMAFVRALLLLIVFTIVLGHINYRYERKG